MRLTSQKSPTGAPSSSSPHLHLIFLPHHLSRLNSHRLYRPFLSVCLSLSSLFSSSLSYFLSLILPSEFHCRSTMGDLTEPSSAPPAVPSRPLPFREDCWSEDATSTLVDAWGRRYLELNRGNLRQKDWQEVADAVNARHGHTKKTRRTDVQCKNRIDTLKKKYKLEKARVSDSNGTITSSWPFFSQLDVLVGSAVKKQSASPPMAVALPYRKSAASGLMTPVVLPQKRPSPAVDDSYFRRNYSAVAAAAAAAEEEGGSEEEEESEDLGTSEESGGVGGQKKGEVEGMKRLARAIERFGEIYERVEGEKQRQMIDLEKQRMQFAKDLEVQRMQLFMDTQVQLEKIKQVKRSGSDDIYS